VEASNCGVDCGGKMQREDVPSLEPHKFLVHGSLPVRDTLPIGCMNARALVVGGKCLKVSLKGACEHSVEHRTVSSRQTLVWELTYPTPSYGAPTLAAS